MTNREARGILANLEEDYRNLDPFALTDDSIRLVNKRIEALGAAISALRAQDVPDNNVGTKLSTNLAGVGTDCISRSVELQEGE